MRLTLAAVRRLSNRESYPAEQNSSDEIASDFTSIQENTERTLVGTAIYNINGTFCMKVTLFRGTFCIISSFPIENSKC
jgi:Ca2+/Na+ antiporter